MNRLFRLYRLPVIGAVAGSIAGFTYYKFIWCVSGSCPITSNPINSSLYGAFMFGFIFNIFRKEEKVQHRQIGKKQKIYNAMNNYQNNHQNINVVDVRTPGEFQSGHADGAINIPLNEIPGKIEFLRGLKGAIILCCASGMRSASALNLLQQYGFTNVSNAGPWYEAQNLLLKSNRQ